MVREVIRHSTSGARGFGSKNNMSKGIIYYTPNDLDPVIFKGVQKQLLKSGLPIVSCSLKPIDFGTNVVLDLEKGIMAYFNQIIKALETSTNYFVFFCEHDVLYHPSHFEFDPIRDDVWYFNTNVWKMRWSDGFAVRTDNSQQVSGMVANRKMVLDWYRSKLQELSENGFDRHYEPKGERVNFQSIFPNICIRHDKNLTPSRWSPDEYRNKENTKGWTESYTIPGWDNPRNI